ncbi:MAG: ABC transporter permease, partial [Coriobacteriales bacterium]|nr:ABC transporter permease [Coriobacteriales bacterium]
ALEAEGAQLIVFDDLVPAADELLATQEVDALLWIADGTLTIKLEGADPSRSAAVLTAVQGASRQLSADERARFSEEIQNQLTVITANYDELKAFLAERGMVVEESPVNVLTNFSPTVTELQVSYLHGDDSWSNFDFYGPVFIGIFIFVFVFITSGMSLVTETTGGTLQRLLATPVKSWQLVAGYSLGFGFMSLIQACIVLAACIWLIGFPNNGSPLLVVGTTFSMALVSLTLGLLVSALARTAFQVIQLMILLVVPQILLSGIFSLSQAPAWMQVLSACFPISYGAEALRDIMLRGAGFEAIWLNLAVLWGFILIFFVLASLSFSRRRSV